MSKEFIILGLLLLVVVLFYRRKSFKSVFSQEPQIRNLVHINIPESLGLRTDLPLENVLVKLQDSMTDQLKEKLRLLFYRDPKNSNVSEHEFNLRYFELQRYFLMCSLLKDVPMFSDEVDEVWHTFILSTRDYDTFSHKFMDEFLHHSPAISRTPNPHGRAWFDLIYTHLFEFTSFTGMTWGAFYRHPLSENQVHELMNNSIEEIRTKYFRAGGDSTVIEALLIKLKDEVSVAIKKGNSTNSRPFTPERKLPLLQQAPFFAQAMIFYSAYHANEYHIKMQDVQHGFMNTTTSSSACGTATTNIDTSSCGSNCNSGSDGGSSCGGGCGGD